MASTTKKKLPPWMLNESAALNPKPGSPAKKMSMKKAQKAPNSLVNVKPVEKMKALKSKYPKRASRMPKKKKTA